MDFCKLKVPKDKFQNASNRRNEKSKMLNSTNSLIINGNLRDVISSTIFYNVLEMLRVRTEKEALTFKYEEPEPVSVSKTSIKVHNSAKSYVDSESLRIFEMKKQLEFLTNAYEKFFKLHPERVALWHELSSQPKTKNLFEKADDLTDRIAKDFVEWLLTLEGDEATVLTVEGVKDMFQIGTQTEAAKTIKVELEEIPCVPKQVAEARNLPHVSKRKMLYREIKRDSKASRMQRKVAAFGRTLPPEAQVYPPQQNVGKKWLTCQNLPEQLESMARVWQGITHLRATKAFCEYLYIEKPEMKAPKYLIDSGLMNPDSIISSNSLGSKFTGNTDSA